MSPFAAEGFPLASCGGGVSAAHRGSLFVIALKEKKTVPGLPVRGWDVYWGNGDNGTFPCSVYPVCCAVSVSWGEFEW